MPKAETTQDKSRALAVQDCHDRAARGQRNVLPALATTRSSHRGDCLRLAIDESQIARPLIPAAYAPPIMAPIDLPAIAAGEIPISSNASRAKTRNSTCAAASRRYSYPTGDHLLSGPNTVHSACFFAIASYCAPTNITPEKTLRPFDSIDSRVGSLTRVSNVAPMRRYR